MATNATEKMEAKVIDWDSFDELPEGEESVLDPESDAFEQVAPPQPGVYEFRVNFAPDNPQVKYDDRNQPYYSARLELTLLSNDKDIDGAKVYPTVTTLIGRGKTNSTMASLMIKGGGRLTSNTSTPKQVLADFHKWILSEPTIRAEVDWQVGFQDSDNSWTTKYSSYKSIPNNPDGKTKPFRFDFVRKDKSMVNTGAILQVRTYFNKGEVINKPSVNGHAAAAVAGVNGKSVTNMPKKPIVVEDDEEEVTELEEQIRVPNNPSGKRVNR